MTEHHQTVRAEPVPAARTAPEPQTPAPVAAPEPGRPRRSRRWWLAMIGSIVGSGVLAAAITLGPTSYRMWTQKDAKLSTPAQAAGLTLDTTESAKSAADDLRTVLNAGFTVTGSVAGVYGDPGDASKSVLFVGGTGFLSHPEKELGQLFSLLDDSGGSVGDVHPVDAGPLGGVMKCGSAHSSDGALTVCGWADYGSLAMALFPDRDENESARLLRELRSAIEKR